MIFIHMKTLSFLFFILCLFVTPIFSQQVTKISGGVGFFMPGVSILTISKINSSLENKNYPKFGNTFTSFGGGGHAIISNFIIGGEGHGLVGKEITTDKRMVNLSSGYGIANLGYILYEKHGLMVYPILGFGGGGLSLSITERTIPTFDQVIDSLKGHVELSTGSFVLNFALGADYLISFDKNANTRGGVLVGIRAGIIYTPIAGNWTMDENKVSGGPETGINGVYLRFLIGGGGTSK